MKVLCALLLLLASAQTGIAQYHVVLEPSIGYVYPPAVEHGFLYDAPNVQSRGAECLLIAANSSVSGDLRLSQDGVGGPVLVSGTVYGLTPGNHGFHLHRDGNTGDGCKAAGPHFNPHNKTHGDPEEENRHAGDFGNIVADNTGVADVAVASELLSLDPQAEGYAVGRAFVVHAGVDDLGKGGNEESLKTGNAGGRLACCVVRTRQ